MGADDLLIPANESNSLGHFELTPAVALNDDALDSLGASWLQPPDLSEVEEQLVHLRLRTAAQFDDLDLWLPGTEPRAIKDPRISLLLPVWLDRLPDAVLVICARNPLAVAASLQDRDGLPLSVGLALWEIYNTAVLRWAPAERTVVVDVEAVCADVDLRRGTLDRIRSLAGVPQAPWQDGFEPDLLRDRGQHSWRQYATARQADIYRKLLNLSVSPPRNRLEPAAAMTTVTNHWIAERLKPVSEGSCPQGTDPQERALSTTEGSLALAHDLAPGLADSDAVVTRIHERDVPVTDLLRADGRLKQALRRHLTDEDRVALASRLTPTERDLLAALGPGECDLVGIALCLRHGINGMAERTGLRADMPDHDVHAMVRTTWSTGGDVDYANVVDVSLREAGLPAEPNLRILDFGCSSGRVVRMLAAILPDVEFAACDVNEGAIAWATAHLPDVDFTRQPLRPPLPYASGSFDAAYAISIWSHFAESTALSWLDEMHRVLKPNGLLLITTHGLQAIAARASNPDHGPAAQRPIVEALYRAGFMFIDTFGTEGDWGVVDPEWGAAFLTPEWLGMHVTPDWSIKLYRPGALERHQDLYVLRRES